MPTLNFKGKSKVHSYHLGVPFHQLNIQHRHSVPPQGQPPSLEDNLIIHGDNLLALKALLPRYAAKINCIIIDPPYNTGNEGWKYNDNVNAPFIREWLAQEVGQDDLEKHDKWLCMMWPRLELMKDLLAEDGVIFVHVDDNEQAHLQLMMNEIFGIRNFILSLVVQLNPRGRSLDKHFAKTHEYILIYAKNAEACCIHPIPKAQKSLDEYKHTDSYGKYRLLALRNTNPVFNRTNRPNLFYPIWVNPLTGECSLVESEHCNIAVYPRTAKLVDDCWTWGTEKTATHLDLLEAKPVRSGGWRIFRKDYLTADSAVTKPKSIWVDKEINNAEGKKTVKNIFSEIQHPFDYPKSQELVKQILRIATDSQSTVLDSFAGSGTTAHAVLELNQEDGGQRNFILVECEDYAHTLTAERVKRVIQGLPHSSDKHLSQGLGGSFTFAILGAELSKYRLLCGDQLPSYTQLAQYVFYTATGNHISAIKQNADYFVAALPQQTAFFLIYEPNQNFLKSIRSVLNLERKQQIEDFLQAHNYHRAIVFASACYCPDQIAASAIQFCSLPFEIHRLAGNKQRLS